MGGQNDPESTVFMGIRYPSQRRKGAKNAGCFFALRQREDAGFFWAFVIPRKDTKARRTQDVFLHCVSWMIFVPFGNPLSRAKAQ